MGKEFQEVPKGQPEGDASAKLSLDSQQPIPGKGAEAPKVADSTVAQGDKTVAVATDYSKESSEVRKVMEGPPADQLQASSDRFAVGKASVMRGNADDQAMYHNMIAENKAAGIFHPAVFDSLKT